MMKDRWDSLSNLYMLNLTQRNNQMTIFWSLDEYFAGNANKERKRHTYWLSSRIMLHLHSIWLGKDNLQKKVFASWPGLSENLVLIYLNKNKQPSSDIFNNLKKDSYPRRKSNPRHNQNHNHNHNQINFPSSAHSVRANIVFIKTMDLTGKTYTNQTGLFPITSRKGNKYILVAYHYNSNIIYEEPLRTQTGVELKFLYH